VSSGAVGRGPAGPRRRVQAGLAVLVVIVAGAAGGDRGALIALLVVALVGLAAVVVNLLPAAPQPLVALGEVEPSRRFPAYDRLYGAVLLSASSGRHVDLTVRPVLQRALAAELEDSGPEAVRARVGERLWRLVDPARPSASDSSRGGLSHAELHDLLDRLEDR